MNPSRMTMTRAALDLPRRFASMGIHHALGKNQRQHDAV
jgi:alpha-D-ribose 1-methylphosphonate 5-triphosphate synthase subunit PhnG